MAIDRDIQEGDELVNPHTGEVLTVTEVDVLGDSQWVEAKTRTDAKHREEFSMPENYVRERGYILKEKQS